MEKKGERLRQPLTSFDIALVIYLGILTGFLGWWARFPR